MKKVLIMMMCVIMVVCFMPTVAMASIENPKVFDNETAEVTLPENFEADGDDGAILAKNGANVTLNGEGKVHATLGPTDYSMAVWATGEGTKVVINGGEYTNETDGTERGTDLIYASGNAIIEINGGTFKAAKTEWTLNCRDNTQSRIIVRGGKYYNFDPSNNTVGEGEIVVPETHKVIKAGDWYYVVEKTSGGGGGITLPPTTPTDNVTNSGSTAADNASTNADLSGSTSTSNGTTTATVDKTTADKIVDKAVENKSTEVVIDATANTTTAANSTTVAQVTIPTETLGAIAEKTEADVTIKTDVAEVKMDNAAAAAVSEQAEGDTVKIIAEKVKEDATEVHFELKVVCSDGKVISDFKGGNIAVTVALPKAMAEKKVVCVYIDDNGHMSKVEGQKNADGTYTFFTGHFSTYAILAEEEADAVIAEQTEAIKNIEIKVSTKLDATKAGKKGIKVTWKTADGKKLDGVEFFRSVKKNSGYGKKAFFTSKKAGTTGYYLNTKSLKKGTRYYYRVRGYVLVDGQKVYTDWSNKGIRTFR